MSSLRVTTNFKDSNGVDLGDELITKDYLMSVYPEIGSQIGIPPELWVWGRGTNGRLGNAVTTNTSTPVTTSASGTNWKQVSAGDTHTAAIKTDGTLWTWGNGQYGGLGNNSTTDVSTPVTTFAGGTNWKQVSAGTYQTAAIKTDGTLWLWGDGISGRLGNAGIIERSTPVTTFAGGTNWKQVSSGSGGSFHTAAIKTDGTLWIWGRGNNGALGNGVTTGTRSTPITTFAGGTNWKQVDCGNLHTTAIKTDGTLWTWGAGTSGQLGNTGGTDRSTPITTFPGGNNWKQVSSGTTYTAAIKTDGTLWTWGGGNYGRLGNNNTTANQLTPVTTFSGGTNWKQVSCGYGLASAIKTDGTLWTWGNGSFGQLGNADTANKLTPVTTFAGGTNWKQVNCGREFTAAIKSVDFASF
jgi:alpha-tubulin suppressor-like RCC1 family protein